jgi:hypothetical protein
MWEALRYQKRPAKTLSDLFQKHEGGKQMNDATGTIVLIRTSKILPYPYDMLAAYPQKVPLTITQPLTLVDDHVEAVGRIEDVDPELNGEYRLLYVLVDREDWDGDDPLEQIDYTEEPDGLERITP